MVVVKEEVVALIALLAFAETAAVQTALQTALLTYSVGHEVVDGLVAELAGGGGVAGDAIVDAGLALIVFNEVAIQITNAAGPIVKVLILTGVALPAPSPSIVNVLVPTVTCHTDTGVGAGNTARQAGPTDFFGGVEEVASQVADTTSPIVIVLINVGVAPLTASIGIFHILSISVTTLADRSILACDAIW